MANQLGGALFIASVVTLAIIYRFKIKEQKLVIAGVVGTFIGLFLMLLF